MQRSVPPLAVNLQPALDLPAGALQNPMVEICEIIMIKVTNIFEDLLPVIVFMVKTS